MSANGRPKTSSKLGLVAFVIALAWLAFTLVEFVIGPIIVNSAVRSGDTLMVWGRTWANILTNFVVGATVLTLGVIAFRRKARPHLALIAIGIGGSFIVLRAIGGLLGTVGVLASSSL